MLSKLSQRYTLATTNSSLILVGLLASAVVGWLMAQEERYVYLGALVVIVLSVIVLLFPWVTMSVYYPLIWPFWSYYIPILAGRPERFVAISALVGMFVVILRSRKAWPLFPSLINVGIFVLIFSYLVAWVFHPNLTQAGEYMLSLLQRLLFFYLTFFHLRTQTHLRWAMTFFIGIGIVAALLTLIVGLQFGFGFLRVSGQVDVVRQSFGPLWTTVALNAHFGTAPALLLLGLYQQQKQRSHRIVILFLVLFLFTMAFAAQFRREVLISVPLVLTFLLFDRGAKLSRATVWQIIGVAFIFWLVIWPSPVLQERLAAESNAIITGTETRLVSTQAGVSAFLSSPLIGAGPGAYRSASAAILGTGYRSFEYSSYNFFLFLAVEAGFLGLVGLLLILYGTIQVALKERKSATNLEGWLLRSTPVVLLQIVVWFTFGNAGELSIPWFLMGVFLAAARLQKETQQLELQEIKRKVNTIWREPRHIRLK